MSEINDANLLVTAWNIKDGFSDVNRASMLIAALERQRPTVAFLSEAYRRNQTEILDNVLEDFDKKKYQVIHAPQELYDNRPDQHGIMMIAQREFIQDLRIIDLAGRRALQAVMVDPATERIYHVFGNHGNDKNEKLRVADEAAKLPYYDLEDGLFKTPTIDIGDKNTMRSDSLIARQLRMVRPLTYLLPAAPPDDPEHPHHGIPRYASLAQRLSGMALGRSYAMYEEVGLINADPEDTPTMWQKVGPVTISVKVDQIFYSPHFRVLEHEVHTRNADEEAGLYTPASDHRAVSAAMHLAA